MKIIRVGAGVAALVTAVGLSGCAGNTATMQTGATPADGHTVYERITAKVYGTGEQREAAQERAWLAAQSAVASCVRARGFEYAVTGYQQMLPTTAPAPGDVLAFAPQRTDFGVALRIRTLAARGETTNPGLAKQSTAAKRNAWFEAVTACQNAAQAGDALAAPAGQEALDSRLADTLASIQNKAAPGLPDQYAACMKASGVQAKSLSDAYMLVEKNFPKVSYEQPSDVTKVAGWAEAVAFEKQVAAADWSCRKDDLEPVFAAAASALEQFETANAPELTTVSTNWFSQLAAVNKLRATVKITK